MVGSDYEERKFISFVKEFIYKNIIFHSDFKSKKSDMCSLILHAQFKLLGVYVLKQFGKFITIINSTEVINELPRPWYLYVLGDPGEIKILTYFVSEENKLPKMKQGLFLWEYQNLFLNTMLPIVKNHFFIKS